MPSPPKPWERAGGVTSDTTAVAASIPSVTTSPAIPVATSAGPTVPIRPLTLNSSADPLSLTSASSTAVSPYGTSTYTSPYSRLGTYSSPYSSYGGYGGYGSTYGGYGGYGGGMYGGYGGMGMGGMGPGMMPMDPNNPSIFQQVGSSTSQTFALIQSIVQTFGGFAQMLDSTFMATQSSFFAMLGVAEQFANLKGALTQVFGVFGLVAWLRSWWRGEKKGNLSSEFKRFLQNPQGVPGPNGNTPPPSKKPLIFFLIAVFGLPYAMHRLIKHLSERLPQNGQLPGAAPGRASDAVVDPSKLSFARATYAFPSNDPVELSLEKGEIVAILSTQDPMTGAEGEWWRGRTREGREGWFPKAYVEIIKRKEVDQPNTGAPEPAKADV